MCYVICCSALLRFMRLFWLGVLGGSYSNDIDDDQISLDPSSNLGMFVRRCLLAFNLLSFEVLTGQNISKLFT